MTAFKFRKEYMDAMGGLAQEVRANLLDAILTYAFKREEPEFGGLERTVFLLVKGMIDADEQHEKELSALREELEEERVRFSEYGKRGGRPKKETLKTPVSENEKPLLTPFSEEKTPLKPPFNPLSENENPLFEEKEGSLQEKEGGKERSKENPQEREYTLPEKERPPYNPPAGEDGTDGSVILSDDDDLAETVRGYKAFLAEFPSVSVDIMNAGELATVDFAVLSERMRKSAFLKTRYSLRWLIRHFPEIKAGAYADFPKRREREGPPPNPLFDKYFPEEDVLQ